MLSTQELETLRRTLEGRAAELQKEIAAKLAEAREDAPNARTGDEGDQSNAETERNNDLAEADRDRAEVDQIRAAIGRMDEGRYGECIDCGLPIPAERLRAQPLALRCIECQSRAERATVFQRPTL